MPITTKEIKAYLKRAEKRADFYFKLRKKGLSDEEARKKIFEEVPE